MMPAAALAANDPTRPTRCRVPHDGLTMPPDTPAPSLNASAAVLVDAMLARAAELGIACHDSCGRVVDCGVKASGGNAAGIAMAEVAMAGLGRVALVPAGDDWEVPTVAVETASPVAACLASQYAGWKVSEKGYFAMASGPIRAAIGREPLFDVIGHRERPAEAVGLLEAGRLPPVEVVEMLANEAGVPASRLTLLVAATASAAGTLQVVARSLETALHKLETLGFDLQRIRRGSGRAPLPPVAGDDLAAIGRTNDAILYGGHVALDVVGDDESLRQVGASVTSSASADHGLRFAELFRRAGGDFYQIDPAVFAPAVVEFHNIDSGRRHRFGRIEREIVLDSFGLG